MDNQDEQVFLCAGCGKERPLSRNTATDPGGYLYADCCVENEDVEDD